MYDELTLSELNDLVDKNIAHSVIGGPTLLPGSGYFYYLVWLPNGYAVRCSRCMGDGEVWNKKGDPDNNAYYDPCPDCGGRGLLSVSKQAGEATDPKSHGGIPAAEYQGMKAEYKAMGYQDYIGEIDADVASQEDCPLCGGHCFGEGVRKDGGYYRAFAVCEDCGVAREF